MRTIGFLIIGILFGITMFKSEAASWFRIYEMFRFEAFHMYGIIATALGLGVLMVQIIKQKNIKSFDGQPIEIAPKKKSVVRYLVGGILFGLGWGLIGACPGPMFVLLGAGIMPIMVIIVFTILGTFLYGVLKDKLPH